MGGGGPKGGGGGADLHLGVGGGARGRHRNDFFPITFIVHNQKSNGGPMGGPVVRMRGAWHPGSPSPELRHCQSGLRDVAYVFLLDLDN